MPRVVYRNIPFHLHVNGTVTSLLIYHFSDTSSLLEGSQPPVHRPSGPTRETPPALTSSSIFLIQVRLVKVTATPSR